VRVLLSFNPEDAAFAEAFRASLFVASPDMEVFVSPILFAEDDRPLALKHAEAFLLFVGPRGLTDQQQQEYDAAIQLSVKNAKFTVVRVLAAFAQVPDVLPRNLTWIEAPVVTDQKMLQQVIDALQQYGALTDGLEANQSTGPISRLDAVSKSFSAG
jgi:hypothetical protein